MSLCPFSQGSEGCYTLRQALPTLAREGALPENGAFSRWPEGIGETSPAKVEIALGLATWILIIYFFTSCMTLDIQLNLSEPLEYYFTQNYPRSYR